MKKKISKLEFPEAAKTDDQANVDVEKDLNGDLLASKELSDVEGGFCEYTCIMCASNGLFSL
jgi:hypothetical protein